MPWTVKFNDSDETEVRDVIISESVLFEDGIGIITPRRATFEGFMNESYIYTYIKEGVYIADKTISSFFVKLYLDEIIKFTGYIDVSKCNYDKKEDSIMIFCYDYTELFNVYADYTKRRIYGGLMNISYYNYFDIFKNYIQIQIGKTLDVQNDISTPSSGGDIELNIISIPRYGLGQIIYSLYNWGLCSPEVGSTVLHVIYQIARNSDGDWWAFIKIHRYFPGYGYSDYNEWFSGDPVDTPETEEWLKEIDKVLAGAGIDRETHLYEPSLSGYTAHMNFEETLIDITYFGQNIPFNFFFGSQCEKPFDNQILLRDDEDGLNEMSYLGIIKDLLLINRATIIAKDDGTINLRNLEEELTTHNITDGIIFFDTSTISVPLDVSYNNLSGYQKITKEITENIYDDLLGLKKILKTIIDNLDSHNIHASDILNIYDDDYLVKSVKRNYEKDEYEITGWKI